MKLWLDDIRDPVLNGLIGWTWVQTADEAIAFLATGDVEEASLDHDLGRAGAEKTGYDVVCWMEENGVWPPNGVHVHSMNPSGAQRMRAVIQRAKLPREEAPK